MTYHSWPGPRLLSSPLYFQIFLSVFASASVGAPPLCTTLSTYLFTVKNFLTSCHGWEHFLSMFRREIGLDWVIAIELSCLGTYVLFAFLHSLKIHFWHNPACSNRRLVRTFGHRLYTLYGTRFGLGDDWIRAFLVTAWPRAILAVENRMKTDLSWICFTIYLVGRSSEHPSMNPPDKFLAHPFLRLWRLPVAAQTSLYRNEKIPYSAQPWALDKTQAGPFFAGICRTSSGVRMSLPSNNWHIGSHDKDFTMNH